MQSICEEEDLLSKARGHFKVSSETSVTELDLSDHSETKFQLADSSTPSSTLETIIKANTKHEFSLRHTDLVNLSPPKTSEFMVLPKILDIEPVQSEFRLRLSDISAAKNDSGISIDSSLDLINADEEEVSLNNQTDKCVKKSENISSLDAINTDEGEVSLSDQTDACVKKSENARKYKKPSQPSLFCKLFQSHLKRHILTKHKEHQSVKPLLKMNLTEQDRFIEGFRKQAMQNHNMNVLKLDRGDFLRERKKQSSQPKKLPLMCSGCMGFFSKSYKARQQLVCSAASVGVMFPMVSIEKTEYKEQHPPEFKELLSTLHLDEVGNCVKSDPVILVIGSRLINAKRKKTDKETGTRISVRTHMRLMAHLCLYLCSFYEKQSEVTLKDRLDNAADIYRREVTTILDKAVSAVTEKQPDEVPGASITDQKSELKVYILNLLKRRAHLLMGHFLMKNEDIRLQRVSDFLTVLKLYENEMFHDAYFDLNYRKNVALRKPIELPKDDDVRRLMDECRLILNSTDPVDYPSKSFVAVRSATATCLIIFCARQGGEPVRLQLYQWEVALKGEWIDKDDLPDEFSEDTMYITYQTGKGSDHLLCVMFPHETIKGMQYLTNPEVPANVGVNKDNP